jgi:hypothetical protein
MCRVIEFIPLYSNPANVWISFRMTHFNNVLVFFLLLAVPASGSCLPSIDVTGVSWDEVGKLRGKLDGTSWWIQLGTYLFSPDLPAVGDCHPDPDIRHYYLAQGARLPEFLAKNRVGRGDGYHVLYLPGGYPSRPDEGLGPYECRQYVHRRVFPVVSGFMAAVPWLGTDREVKTGISDPEVQLLVDQLDTTRFMSTVQDLVDFGSRNTTWAGSSVEVARDYIVGRFQSQGMITTTPGFDVFGVGAFNVTGILEGSTRPDEFLVVGAHYDSLPPTGSAPGAEDNASGTAGLIEIARVLSSIQPQRSVRFVAFSGEEQGLFGSQDFVDQLLPGEIASFSGAIIMDMISFTADAQLDVLLETRIFAAGLLNDMAQAAADFTSLTVFQSFNPFGSDHIPFLNHPDELHAVLAIENDWDVYPGYHQAADTIEKLTPEQGIEILRMNLAAMLRLANPDPVDNSTRNWFFY